MFDSIIIWLYRHRQNLEIKTDLYNHKFVNIYGFEIKELSENYVSISSDTFYIKLDNLKELFDIVKGIKGE